jgi:hypothetical protein
MSDERRSVPYGRIFAIEGKYEGITTAPHPVDRSKSYNHGNRKGLSSSEYLEYEHFVGVLRERGIGTRDFPLDNPTRERYSKLLVLIKDKDLDLE